MQVIGYIRVSTSDQAANGDSLDTQRQQIIGYAMMKGWQVSQFFIEAGVSGSVPLAARPEAQRLLAIAKAGDVIITARLDRAFRSAADALVTLEELKRQGIGLHMIDLGGDVCGNGISKLVFTILSAVAENERDRIRERIRDVKRHLAHGGNNLGAVGVLRGDAAVGCSVHVSRRTAWSAGPRPAIARRRSSTNAPPCLTAISPGLRQRSLTSL
jgi:putative DNA-invertase from lambdoid prophage Rac